MGLAMQRGSYCHLPLKIFGRKNGWAPMVLRIAE
jgi:hypothetical protein